MSREVAGVSLARLEGHIHYALSVYEECCRPGVQFDKKNALKLIPTPERVNSARSETGAFYRGEWIGNLYVIAFKPGDGTGSEADYKLEDLVVEPPYPRQISVVPRIKSGVYHEAHLTVVTQEIDNVQAMARLFRGHFDLLGLEGNTVRKIGALGVPPLEEGLHTATLTVGLDKGGRRFGDPHAVYSRIPNLVQICAFLAISDDIHRKYPELLAGLTPQFPLPK